VPARPLLNVCIALALAAGANLAAALTDAAGLPGSPQKAIASELPRIQFVAAPGSSVLLHGTYPKVSSSCVSPVQPIMHARYSGTIEIGRDTDGKLFVIGVLPFEDYLKGIAEVPRTWPMAALKAQVVAARSYALAHLAYPDPTGARLGYQLCATDACQVYRGLGISDGPYGDRWVKAVDGTASQVLLYGGRPADTVYFSTSKGTTVGNEKVFGSAPLPYLRPVKEHDDGASPLSHWTVTLPFGDVTRFLRASGRWGSGSVTSVTRDGDNVVVKGGGRSDTLARSDFRSSINAWAHCLDPARYPTFTSSGYRLPQTVPSKWFSTSNSGSSVVLTGRGWGHGVGMVQWGAYGKALRGVSYQDILADYYGGLRPVEYSEPSEIRIGIAVGLSSVTVQPSGDVTVDRADAGSQPWLVTGGKKLRIRHGRPAPNYMTAGLIVNSPSRGRSGQTVTVTASVPELSVAHLVLRAPGPDLRMDPGTTVQAGTTTVSATVPDVPSGTYRLQLQLTNGIDIVGSRTRKITVTGVSASPSQSPTSPPPSPSGVALAPTSSSPAAPIAIGAACVAAVGLALFFLRRTRRRPAPPSAG